MKPTEARSLNKSLREVFGLEKLRPGQREVIAHVLEQNDVLAIMPTGGGKSLCYQLPGLHMSGMTIVVSPLISLMKDQTDKLDEIGVDTANLNSAVPESEQQQALENVENEDSDFVFTTPERLTDAEFLKTLKDKNINFIVIDEAHCISQWGHDFRPAFLELREAFRQLGEPPVLALTATATPQVIEDIKKQLGRPKMEVIRGGIFRPNLRFDVVHTTSDAEKRQEVSRLLGETKGSKIVYCATVKAVNEVVKFLQDAGMAVESYHGKMPAKKRTDVQDRFMNGDLETIVATNAFGMGVDKPDIRSVIHWQIPGTLEAYYQEAGRAGRDEKDARCTLLYDTRDRRVQQFFMGGRYPSEDDLLLIFNTLKTFSSAEPPQLKQIQETLADGISKTKLRVGLNLLKDEKIVREKRGSIFELAKSDISDEEIKTIAGTYAERGMSDREKLERMMLYAQSALCRWKILAEYFETDENIDHCGTCDNCVTPMAERIEAVTPKDRPLESSESLSIRMERQRAAD